MSVSEWWIGLANNAIPPMNVYAKLPISILIAFVTGGITASLVYIHLRSETYQNYIPPDFVFHSYFLGLRADYFLPPISNIIGVVVGVCAFRACRFPSLLTRYHIPFLMGISGLGAAARYTWRFMHAQLMSYDAFFCGPIIIVFTIMFSLMILLTAILYVETGRKDVPAPNP